VLFRSKKVARFTYLKPFNPKAELSLTRRRNFLSVRIIDELAAIIKG